MSLKIKTLKLEGIRQFLDVTFDFTDPKTGEALDRICFIGGNGTGKSTILRILSSWQALNIPGLNPTFFETLRKGNWAVEFTDGQDCFTAGSYSGQVGWANDFQLFTEGKFDHSSSNQWSSWQGALAQLLAVYCPPDSEMTPHWSSMNDVPLTNLDAALQFLRSPSLKFVVGQENVAGFWQHLIALVKHREARLLEYSQKPANQERTVRQVREEFLEKNPDILKELTELWKPILGKAGLLFDFKEASIPIQLTDNLKAYIKLAADNSVIPYADLSTGIRSFLFRLGHLFTIFRFHPNKGGIVLIDEPENSLYPDFLFDLVGYYEQSAPGAQMFFATHSPIVAAQFKPEERFILEFDPDLGIKVRRGVTPEGDDPNDVLLKDFAVRTLYGTKGVESWKRFRELDLSIQTETDPQKRKAMLKEYLELGRTYNFDPQDEVSA